jgi:hypothetical protein
MAVAEKAVVPDAMKSVRQHMDQEAADEFLTRKGHRLLAIVIPVKVQSGLSGAGQSSDYCGGGT